MFDGVEDLEKVVILQGFRRVLWSVVGLDMGLGPGLQQKRFEQVVLSR